MKKIKSFFATPSRAIVSVICLILLLVFLGAGAFLMAGFLAKHSGIGAESARNILEREAEPFFGATAASPDHPTAESAPQAIPETSMLADLETAKSIALEHANASASDVVFTKANEDYDDGYLVYEIEFRKDQIEYEYEIDAVTSEILKFDSGLS